MNMDRNHRVVHLSTLLIGAVLAPAGCEFKGSAELAGEIIDKAVKP